MTKHWTLDDIAWHDFDSSKIDPDSLAVVKAAALVEYNGGDYARYLHNIFQDDPVFKDLASQWAVEEVQHGEALGRWAEMADPHFDFQKAVERFRASYQIPLDVGVSVRGSLTSELVARCIVETGTSSFYSALRDAAREPVLRQICANIAADEFRHYKLFYTHMQKYLSVEKVGRFKRFLVALGRIKESEDDELAMAYHCANSASTSLYTREHAMSAYASRAYRFYRRDHCRRAVAMILKAAGLNPQGWLAAVATRLFWLFLQRQTIKPVA